MPCYDSALMLPIIERHCCAPARLDDAAFARCCAHAADADAAAPLALPRYDYDYLFSPLMRHDADADADKRQRSITLDEAPIKELAPADYFIFTPRTPPHAAITPCC